MEPTLLQEIMYEQYKEEGELSNKVDFLCEGSDDDHIICGKPADTEWKAKDEDGDTYYTFRCDDHPVDDSDFEAYPA